LEHFLTNLPGWVRDDLFYDYTPRQLVAKVFRRTRALLRKVGNRFWAPPGEPKLNLEEMFDGVPLPESFMEVCLANYKALLSYMPKAYPNRFVVVRARSQPLFGYHAPDLGWGALAPAGIECHVTPGNHNSILQEPHVKTLALLLKTSMERAYRVNPSSVQR
jgi:hypothetical protein